MKERTCKQSDIVLSVMQAIELGEALGVTFRASHSDADVFEALLVAAKSLAARDVTNSQELRDLCALWEKRYEDSGRDYDAAALEACAEELRERIGK